MQRIEIAEIPSHVSGLQRFSRVFFSRGIVIFGIVIILAFILMAIFAPLIAPYDPYKINPKATLLQPSSEHLLGTDSIGRDTLSRVIYGSRVSLMAGLFAVLAAAIPGIALGMIGGYFGGWVNMVIMRLMDALMSFPGILLALVFAGLLGGGLTNVIIALGISFMPGYARLTNGMVLSAKENDYILAAHSIGINNGSIMFRHLLPNCIPPLIVQITIMLGLAIVAEAALSFLGVGIKPPTPSWGSLISDGVYYLRTNPMLTFAPGIFMMLVVFAFNMVGDGLRDALDPKLRGTL
ncbi:MAG: ABC transporter permease [Dehalococcoidales bacterium]|nr:ABC transporter permease [Dehalococcoidales bacterium]